MDDLFRNSSAKDMNMELKQSICHVTWWYKHMICKDKRMKREEAQVTNLSIGVADLSRIKIRFP